MQKLPGEIGSKLEDWYRYVESSGGPVVATPAGSALSGAAKPAKRLRSRRRFRFSAGTGSGAEALVAPVAARETREELLARLLDPVLTLEEAAQVLNVCPTTVRRYTNRGLLEHYRTVGNQRRFRLSHVLAFLGEMSERVGVGTLEDTAALMAGVAAARRIEVRFTADAAEKRRF